MQEKAANPHRTEQEKLQKNVETKSYDAQRREIVSSYQIHITSKSIGLLKAFKAYFQSNYTSGIWKRVKFKRGL